MATTSKNLNTGSWRTLSAFAPLFADASDFAVVLWLGGSSSQGMGCEGMAGDSNLGGVLLDFQIPGSPEDRPEVKVSHRNNYQTEYGPPIVSTRDALKRIPN
ncbi:hypothetical protein CCAX7_10010 [Capsulimonas corticalis]|uniref:Uncharacterized protein n=1 Tax=Capsulimonas corticalis TaxID=2219043 RepID=A0A402CUE6_9BACT|nr:hypothetical protein [Capsulimonas corticalis]BDI28950.1 hypothetical protein CCAX7_10010 [Capsulimonas corticalis]